MPKIYGILRKRSVIHMANTSAVYARIDSGLKEDAEKILKKLGITPSVAIQMFYSQIVLTNGLPLDLHLPAEKPVAIGGMSREEIDAELKKGIESMKEGTFTPDEVDAEISEMSERLPERNKAVYEELEK